MKGVNYSYKVVGDLDFLHPTVVQSLSIKDNRLHEQVKEQMNVLVTDLPDAS